MRQAGPERRAGGFPPGQGRTKNARGRGSPPWEQGRAPRGHTGATTPGSGPLGGARWNGQPRRGALCVERPLAPEREKVWDHPVRPVCLFVCFVWGEEDQEERQPKPARASKRASIKTAGSRSSGSARARPPRAGGPPAGCVCVCGSSRSPRGRLQAGPLWAPAFCSISPRIIHQFITRAAQGLAPHPHLSLLRTGPATGPLRRGATARPTHQPGPALPARQDTRHGSRCGGRSQATTRSSRAHKAEQSRGPVRAGARAEQASPAGGWGPLLPREEGGVWCAPFRGPPPRDRTMDGGPRKGARQRGRQQRLPPLLSLFPPAWQHHAGGRQQTAPGQGGLVGPPLGARSKRQAVCPLRVRLSPERLCARMDSLLLGNRTTQGRDRGPQEGGHGRASRRGPAARRPPHPRAGSGGRGVRGPLPLGGVRRWLRGNHGGPREAGGGTRARTGPDAHGVTHST